jgi:hypothetical protein
MPDKPAWYGRLPEIAAEIEALPYPWIDRATVEHILRVGRRRAQQILAPAITRRIGRNGLADRELFLQHLRCLAAGETAYYERRRRQKLAARLAGLNRAWVARPRLLVQAPAKVANQNLASLPPGITIAPGQIEICFRTPTQALEKLLALAMAIGNDPDGFERLATRMVDHRP